MRGDKNGNTGNADGSDTEDPEAASLRTSSEFDTEQLSLPSLLRKSSKDPPKESESQVHTQPLHATTTEGNQGSTSPPEHNMKGDSMEGVVPEDNHAANMVTQLEEVDIMEGVLPTNLPTLPSQPEAPALDQGNLAHYRTRSLRQLNETKRNHGSNGEMDLVLQEKRAWAKLRIQERAAARLTDWDKQPEEVNTHNAETAATQPIPLGTSALQAEPPTTQQTSPPATAAPKGMQSEHAPDTPRLEVTAPIATVKEGMQAVVQPALTATALKVRVMDSVEEVVQPQKAAEAPAPANTAPQSEVVQPRKASATPGSALTQPPARGEKGTENPTAPAKDHGNDGEDSREGEKMTEGEKMAEGESEEEGGPSIKKLKGASLGPEKKRKRTKAAITRITELEAGGIEKESSKGMYNRVILSPMGAFQLSFPAVSREEAARQWTGFTKYVANMHDTIKAEVFNTEFSRDELELLDMRAAAEFFPALVTVDGTLRARSAKTKGSLLEPLTGVDAEKQQLKRLKSRGALFKKIGNAAHRQAKIFEEAVKKTASQIQSNQTVTPVANDEGEVNALNSLIKALGLEDTTITAEDHNELVRSLVEYLTMVTERLRQELAVQVTYIHRHSARIAEKESNLLKVIDYTLDHLSEKELLPDFLDYLAPPAHLCKCQRCVPVEQPPQEQKEGETSITQPLQLIMRPGTAGAGLDTIVWGPKAISKDVVCTVWTATESPASVCKDFFTENCPGWAQEDYRVTQEDEMISWNECSEGLERAHNHWQAEIDAADVLWQSQPQQLNTVDHIKTEEEYTRYSHEFNEELQEECEDEAPSHNDPQVIAMIQRVDTFLDESYQEDIAQWASLPTTAVLRNHRSPEETAEWDTWKYQYTTIQGQRDREAIEEMKRELAELRLKMQAEHNAMDTSS